METIYVGVDPVQASFATDLQRSYDALAANRPGLKLYALLDAAFLQHERFAQQMKTWGASSFYAFAYEPLVDASPHLMLLNADKTKRAAQLRRILRVAGQYPMTSFMASDREPAAIIEGFQYFVEASVESEDQSFLLRFADVRVLPGLDDCLRAREAGTPGWRKGIAAWWYPDRRGKFQQLPGLETDAGLGMPKGHLSLTHAEFELLLDYSEPDTLLDIIYDQNPELLLGSMPGENHCLVSELRATAKKYSIDNFPDLVIFCTVGLSTSKFFPEVEEFKKVLQNADRRPGGLGDELTNVEESAWVEAASLKLMVTSSVPMPISEAIK